MHTLKGVVFDLYGTLYDVHSVAASCDRHYPGRGMEISTLWRQKQLEYTWLRSLMDRYLAFEDVTRDALIHTCNRLKLALDDEKRVALCDAYLRLDPYPEVPAALAALREMGLPLAILSNGSVNSIDQVVGHSGLRDRFDFLLSVEQAGIFKPHTKVYELAEQALRLRRAQILFVSSNPWDASGARHFGYTVCWLNRNANTFDELGVRPDVTLPGLDAVPRWIGANLAE